MNLLREAIIQSALGPSSPTADDGHCRRFRFRADFPGFSGHFPGYPILPAILQVLLAQMLVEETAGTEMRLAGLERARFTRRILPEETVRVTVVRQAKEGPSRYDARLTVDDEAAAQFVLVFSQLS